MVKITGATVAEQLKRAFVVFLGLSFACMGITLYVLSGYGNDPISVFNQGLSKTLTISFGDAITVTNISLILIAMIFAIRYIRWGTVILTLFLGTFVNLFSAFVLQLVGSNPEFAVRTLMFILGTPLMGAGFGTIISAEFGTGPSDALLLKIVSKTGWQYRILKICSDAVFFLSGWLLGGTFGVGTIVEVFLMGPIIDFTRRKSQKYLIPTLGLKVKSTVSKGGQNTMSQSKRVFLIVLDSFGIGELPDAGLFGDEGSNTLGAIANSSSFHTPNLQKLGLFNIEGVTCGEKSSSPLASFARLGELSMGKDTTIGHWEIAGIVSPKPLPTYPNGFPKEVIDAFEKATGRRTVCNLPYSGTKVLDDYADEQFKDGALIVYTSADSVFQIAAHEELIPLETLYHYCEIAREQLRGEHGVGRIIARPFLGQKGNYQRTPNRRDFSLEPPAPTMLDFIGQAGLETIGVGKIYDIFAGKGISKKIKTKSNHDGMEKTIELAKEDFSGLCFVNLVDFDMVYGHRNNVDGYAGCATEFDGQLGELLPLLREDDILMITADHGCDPATPSTDHSREYVPMLLYGHNIKNGVDLKTRKSFSDMAATIAEYLGVKADIKGESFLKQVLK